MKEDGRVQIAVRITPEIKKKLKIYLAHDESDIQTVLENAVNDYINRYESINGIIESGKGSANELRTMAAGE